MKHNIEDSLVKRPSWRGPSVSAPMSIINKDGTIVDGRTYSISVHVPLNPFESAKDCLLDAKIQEAMTLAIEKCLIDAGVVKLSDLV